MPRRRRCSPPPKTTWASTIRESEVVGSHHGYYAPGDESRIADEIREGRPDILFVANSSPAKEKFLAQFVDRMNVPVCPPSRVKKLRQVLQPRSKATPPMVTGTTLSGGSFTRVYFRSASQR